MFRHRLQQCDSFTKLAYWILVMGQMVGQMYRFWLPTTEEEACVCVHVLMSLSNTGFQQELLMQGCIQRAVGLITNINWAAIMYFVSYFQR